MRNLIDMKIGERIVGNMRKEISIDGKEELERRIWLACQLEIVGNMRVKFNWWERGMRGHWVIWERWFWII